MNRVEKARGAETALPVGFTQTRRWPNVSWSRASTCQITRPYVVKPGGGLDDAGATKNVAQAIAPAMPVRKRLTAIPRGSSAVHGTRQEDLGRRCPPPWPMRDIALTCASSEVSSSGVIDEHWRSQRSLPPRPLE